MNCRRAKTLIYDFIDGMIGDQNRIVLEKHLGECESCDVLATSLSKSLDLLHSVPQLQPSDNFNWKVRLGITQARNAIVSDTATERSWLRSWNIRFALSAVSTFVVVAATGYFLTRSSVLPSSDRITVSPQSRATALRPTDPALQNRAAEAQPSQPRVEYDQLAQPSAPFRPNLVSTGDPLQADDASMPLIAEVDFDSLANYFRGSRMAEVRAQYRMQLLEKQVKALQGELGECAKEDK
jgi:hypothetical protein